MYTRTGVFQNTESKTFSSIATLSFSRLLIKPFTKNELDYIQCAGKLKKIKAANTSRSVDKIKSHSQVTATGVNGSTLDDSAKLTHYFSPECREKRGK